MYCPSQISSFKMQKIRLIISLSYSLLINRTFHSSISKLFFTVLCELTWNVLHLHDKVVLKMLTFMFMICIINEEFCHIMENLQKKYNKKLLETEVVWFFISETCFTFSLKNVGFQLFLLENNNLTVIMNDEMPDKRQVGLVHENYVSVIIWWVHVWYN